MDLSIQISENQYSAAIERKYEKEKENDVSVEPYCDFPRSLSDYL